MDSLEASSTYRLWNRNMARTSPSTKMVTLACKNSGSLPRSSCFPTLQFRQPQLTHTPPACISYMPAGPGGKQNTREEEEGERQICGRQKQRKPGVRRQAALIIWGCFITICIATAFRQPTMEIKLKN